MPIRCWQARTKDKFGLDESETITLNKLKRTVRCLKQKGDAYADNCWATPIVPLLIEHVFLEAIDNLQEVSDITLELNEGRDIKLC